MICFTVWKSNNQYRGFSLEGHAGYAKAGWDIVCAAVSALVFNTANSIEALTEDFFEQELARDGGYLRMDFPKELSKEAVLLIDSLLLGIKSIETEYGKKYITLTIKEV